MNTDRVTVLPGRYRHFKGQDYQVLDLATHSETGEALVVYRCLYGDYDLWVRPLSLFAEQVKVGDDTVPRFRYLGPDADAGENMP